MKKRRAKKEGVDYLALLSEKTERINELKSQNEELLLLLEEYRLREREISNTLAFTKKKCEEITDEARIRYSMECERLKLYRAKWMRAINAGGAEAVAKSYEKTMETLRSCQLELETMLATDLGEDLQAYISERDRLNDEPMLDYQAVADNGTENEYPDTLSDEEINELLSQL